MLQEYRKQLDAIDDEIAALYRRRMALSEQVGREKAKTGAPLSQREREREIVRRVTKDMPEDIKLYGKQLFETLFETGKAYQCKFINKHSALTDDIRAAIAVGRRALPASAAVACQGVRGAYSGIAAEKLFPLADISFVKTFDAVFQAVEKGLCAYGILPIENSSAGSVDAVYDLMKKHRCFILRSVRLKVEHCLLGLPGAQLKEVRTVTSHAQAVEQCKSYLAAKPDVKVHIAENTAAAAQSVAEQKNPALACIASEACAELYGLSVLQRSISDNKENFTRFICIAKDMEIILPATRISLMAGLPHEPGSLNRLLSRFAALGLNLTKLESRPAQDSGFEFMFYFDFDADIEKQEVLSLLAELEETLPFVVFLGSYSEVL